MFCLFSIGAFISNTVLRNWKISWQHTIKKETTKNIFGSLLGIMLQQEAKIKPTMKPSTEQGRVILKNSLSGQLKFIVNFLPLFQGSCWCPKLSSFLLQGFLVFEYYPTTSQVKTLLNLLKSSKSKSWVKKYVCQLFMRIVWALCLLI